MFETLDKLMLAGLGALVMTRERAEKIFDDYVSRGLAEKDARSGFVRDLMEASEKTRQDMQAMIQEQMQKAIQSLNLADKDDIRRLEEEVKRLQSSET